MSYSLISLDVEGHARHHASISPSWPSSRDPFVERARARARAVFEIFEASPEAKALDSGCGQVRWPILVMREACFRHGKTIDTMTPEVFQAVSEIFVEADTIAAYAHWCAVVQEELEAFFRFLARGGFVHAEGCLEVLARLAPIRERRYSRLCAASCTPLTDAQAQRFITLASCGTSAPCERAKPE